MAKTVAPKGRATTARPLSSLKMCVVVPAASAFGRNTSTAIRFIGALRKITELISTVCPVEYVESNDPLLLSDLKRCDAALVRADRSDGYRAALRAGKPYLLLVNDLATMRDPSADKREERRMIEEAHACIFSTGPLLTYASEHYLLPPHVVVASRPLASDLEFDPLPQLPGRHLVYAGGLAERAFDGTPWGYRVYHDLFSAVMRSGWTMHVYPPRGRPRAERELAELGCVIHEPVIESRLPRELSQYTAGMQAYNTRGVPAPAVTYARLAWPNKTWLYLSAGIPTIGFNRGWESGRIYDGKWGIVLGSPQELRGISRRRLPTITEELRYSQTMDTDLPLIKRMLRLLG